MKMLRNSSYRVGDIKGRHKVSVRDTKESSSHVKQHLVDMWLWPIHQIFPQQINLSLSRKKKNRLLDATNIYNLNSLLIFARVRERDLKVKLISLWSPYHEKPIIHITVYHPAWIAFIINEHFLNEEDSLCAKAWCTEKKKWKKSETIKHKSLKALSHSLKMSRRSSSTHKTTK